MVDTPPLSVSPRADSDDADSMAGTTPRRFWVPWDRAALDFVGMSVEVHEKLAERLGAAAAADVLLLVVAHHCGTNERKRGQARDLGIPWKRQRWMRKRKKDTGTETEEETEEDTEEGHGSSEVSNSMRGTSPVPQPEEDLIPLPSFHND